ncbi:hypothetical protein COW38_03445, partial [Candidatus Collierbacteria bacterium CG17_big_fil_post_rev_8_21_14_2_50_45_7]
MVQRELSWLRKIIRSRSPLAPLQILPASHLSISSPVINISRNLSRLGSKTAELSKSSVALVKAIMSTRKNNSQEPVIKVTNISKVYELGEEKLQVLDDISLTIHAGELVAIVGPSGSGKSTLMHIMGLLDKQSAGTVELAGHDVSMLSEVASAKLRNKYIGFIFQQFNLLTRTSSLENVLLPTLYSDPLVDKTQKAIDILTNIGMGERLKNYSNQLSGGQQQRVAIARALVNDPTVIF